MTRLKYKVSVVLRQNGASAQAARRQDDHGEVLGKAGELSQHLRLRLPRHLPRRLFFYKKS
jgi:hypothetical protein